MSAPIVTIGRNLQNPPSRAHSANSLTDFDPIDIQTILWGIAGAEPPPGQEDNPQGAITTAALYIGLVDNTPVIDEAVVGRFVELIPNGSNRYLGRLATPWGHLYADSLHGSGTDLTGVLHPGDTIETWGPGGSREKRKYVTATVDLSGSASTAADLIPAGAREIQVVARVLTEITGSGGLLTWEAGITESGLRDLWVGKALAAATVAKLGDGGAVGDDGRVYPAGAGVTLYVGEAGETFSGGTIRLVIFYTELTEPTS